MKSDELAALWTCEQLKRMLVNAGIALDRAKGREILPARLRYWSIEDALEKRIETEQRRTA